MTSISRRSSIWRTSCLPTADSSGELSDGAADAFAGRSTEVLVAHAHRPMARVFTDGSFRLPDGGYAQALGVVGDRIVVVGSAADVRESMPRAAKTISIDGGVAFPGFCDAHVHVLNFGRARLGASCWPNEISSVRDIVAKVRLVEAGLPVARWVRGRGFDPSRLRERRPPLADELDLPSGRPVVLDSFDFHRRVANHAAMRAAGIDRRTPDPPGGMIVRDDAGEPTGELFDAARGLIDEVMPAWTSAEDREAFLTTSRHFASAGFTHVMNAAPLGMKSPGEEVRAFAGASAEGVSIVRISTMVGVALLAHVDFLGVPVGFGNDRVRLNGVKIFSDGAFGPRTACVRDPYEGGGYGHLSIGEDELETIVRDVRACGWRACVHAIGDGAVEMVSRVMVRVGSASLPHRIEHCCLTTAASVDRMAAADVVPVPQMPFLRQRSVDFAQALGGERMSRLYPLRTWIDAGLRPLHSSDAPVVHDVRPMASVFSAVTRRDEGGRVWGAEEAVTLDEAIAMLTTWPARAEGVDDRYGKLLPGFVADLTVLPEDPYACDVDDVENMEATMTVLGGDVVWRA